jgi:DNA-directed RNA polymerase delta subunit
VIECREILPWDYDIPEWLRIDIQHKSLKQKYHESKFLNIIKKPFSIPGYSSKEIKSTLSWYNDMLKNAFPQND